ncbi:glycosyltransferase family 4 protein [Mucilaginibacter sp.]|uniref:glycosyltransferase family 4 protein n=1 Tax=Mucilaginibacter sp. TaxID=1882438 RepID=UPI0035BBF9F5
MKKLAIIVSHPVQYYAPVFRLLTSRGLVNLRVFYTWGEKAVTKHDPGFSKTFAWDIPLLDGYAYEWVINTAADPGSHHFNGIVNPKLIASIDRFAPDALLVFGWAYRSHLRVLCHYHGRIPIYFRGDSTLLDESGSVIKRQLKTFWLKWVYRHIDHAFFVGTNNKAYFRKYGLQETQLSFAPHAVDNERFGKFAGEAVKKIRDAAGVPEDNILILFAGKFENKKSPELLMDAFLTLSGNNCHLLFAGSGPLETLLRQKATGKQHIKFMDFQNQSGMPALYQACDVFCLPSGGPAETWGLAVNEAMACGKPVVVSNKVGCAADLVTVANGGVFESGSTASLLNIFNNLLVNRKMLKLYGERSAQIIKDWNFAAFAEAIEKKIGVDPVSSANLDKKR